MKFHHITIFSLNGLPPSSEQPRRRRPRAAAARGGRSRGRAASPGASGTPSTSGAPDIVSTRVLEVPVERQHGIRPALQREVGADQRRVRRAPATALRPARRAAPSPSAPVASARAARGGARTRARRAALRVGQRDPQLGAVQHRRSAASGDCSACAMPAPDGHQPELAGTDQLRRCRGCRGGAPRRRAASSPSAARCADAAEPACRARGRCRPGRSGRRSTRRRPCAGPGSAAAAGPPCSRPAARPAPGAAPAPGRPSHTCTAGSAAMLLTRPRYDPHKHLDRATMRPCAARSPPTSPPMSPTPRCSRCRSPSPVPHPRNSWS